MFKLQCQKCNVVHHTPFAVAVVNGVMLCYNTAQCEMRMGRDYSASKAIRLVTGKRVTRSAPERYNRALYLCDGLLWAVGVHRPKEPPGSLWLKHQVQTYVRTPKVLWCSVHKNNS